MTQVIIDSSTKAKLVHLTGRAEICDEFGKVLGHFTPVFDPSQYEGIEPDSSEEELDRRQKEGGGRTLAEILADLEKRA
jgi:hypothetical protein